MVIKEHKQGLPLASKLLVGVFLGVIVAGIVTWLAGGMFPPFPGS